MKNMSPKTRIIIGWICIIFTLFVILYIWIDVTGKKYNKKAETLTKYMDEYVPLYGDSIDHYAVNGSSVSVYVNTEQWNRTEKSVQQDFEREICTIVKSAMNEGDIDVATVGFFTADRKEINIVNVKR